MNECIVIRDPLIVDFYSRNKHLDIESINRAWIAFYEAHIVPHGQGTDEVGGIAKDVANDILSHIHALRHDLDTRVLTKFGELKQGYLDDLKPLLEHHSNGNFLRIIEKLDKEHAHLLDQTQLMMQRMGLGGGPGGPESLFHQEHERTVRAFKEEMGVLLGSMKSDVSMDKIYLVLSQEYHKLITNVQQHVLTHVSTSEHRLHDQIGEVKTLAQIHGTHQVQLGEEVSSLLSQFRVSQKKGEMGEHRLNQLLGSLFPSSEIVNTTGQTSAGDYMVTRSGNHRPVILFENKHFHSGNVPKRDVDKFIHDVEQQHCSGILMAQTSGIALKHNFEIDIHQGQHVLVYLHHMNYDPEKLMVAVDIIDHLTAKLRDHFSDTHVSLSPDVLHTINQQYQTFLDKRDRILSQMTQNHKKTVADIKDLTMNELQLTLSNLFASTSSSSNTIIGGDEVILPSITCTICNVYTTNNTRSLNAHLPACKKKNVK
jgi:hypothetical protein